MMQDLVTAVIQLHAQSLQRLDELHDDYFRTNALWQEQVVSRRYSISFSIRNAKTGNVTAGVTEWVDRARASQRRLRVRTFKDIAAEVELFLNGLLKAWFLAQPQLVEEKSITLAALLACTDLPTARQMAIQEAVDAAVLKRMTDKPSRWFSFLSNQLNCQIDKGDVASFVERKAARDVLEHHSGWVDSSYLDKAGDASRYQVGDLIEPDDVTIDMLYDLVKRLVDQIAVGARHRAGEL